MKVSKSSNENKKGFTLAESATHVATCYNSRKVAFTLAEVLITLGIIGVVAAMTIPTLVKNYQKTVWVNQLKKSVSTLEQGFQKMLADDGVDDLEDTEAFKNIHGNIAGDGYEPNDQFTTTLRKYFQIKDITDIEIDGVETKDAIIFTDGTTLVYWSFDVFSVSNSGCEDIKANGGSLCKIVGSFNIDINGLKGPNTYGRDMFSFVIGANGHLYPAFGKDSALYSSSFENYYWKTSPVFFANCAGNPVQLDTYKKAEETYGGDAHGQGCTARIIENGWKMDY